MLKPTELLDKAEQRAQSDDFGDYNNVNEWLGMLLDEIRTPYEQVLEYRLLVALENRLRVVDYQPFQKPLYASSIFGLPRTGTTILYDLLCLSSTARPLLAYEARWPTLRDKAETKAWFESSNRAIPALSHIHPLRWNAPNDIYAVLEHTLQSHAWGLAFPLTRYLRELDAEPASGIFRFLRDALCCIDDPDGWLLKESAHLMHLGDYLDVFDGPAVWIHRDPVDSVASLCSLVGAVHEATCGETPGLGDRELSYVVTSLSGAHRADRAHPGRVLHVEYDDLLQDPYVVLQLLWDRLGFVDPGPQRVAAHLIDHPQPKHPYRLGDFGLSVRVVDSALGGLR